MIKIKTSIPFERETRRLKKKYRSLTQDIRELMDSMQELPLQGRDLGRHLRKVRMAIRSKGKGKSGGARVITHVEAITAEVDGVITFLYIYDKSERSSITDQELTQLLESLDE